MKNLLIVLMMLFLLAAAVVAQETSPTREDQIDLTPRIVALGATLKGPGDGPFFVFTRPQAEEIIFQMKNSVSREEYNTQIEEFNLLVRAHEKVTEQLIHEQQQVVCWRNATVVTGAMTLTAVLVAVLLGGK